MRRFNSGKSQKGSGRRTRDVDLPEAPERVTDNAQAKASITTTCEYFDFDQPHRGRLPERPSTAAGPSSHSSRRKEAERRETQDDLHFNPLAAHGKGIGFHDFPLPGSLPTPDQTQPPPPRTSSLAAPRSFTPESKGLTPTNMSVLPTEIGMALGSPSHQPTDWQTQNRLLNATRSPSPDMMEDSMGGLAEPPKPKASKWKMLGGIFGGRKQSASQATPFYQLQPEPIQKAGAPAAEFMAFEDPTFAEKPPKSHGRERAFSQRKASKKKPAMQRANTAPVNFDLQGNGQYNNTPMITLDGGPLADNVVQSVQKGIPYPGQMLDVDIPSVQMERYSIMFGSVLQKSSNTSSSLLARRQATLDKLKTVNEDLALRERELQNKERLFMPRRATSPGPTKSPAFSLFPSTPTQLTARESSPSRGRETPLHRSNTSPAALSPSRPAFAPGPDIEAHKILISPPTNLIGPSHSQYEGASMVSKVQQKEEPKVSSSPFKISSAHQHIRKWSPDHSQLILDSPVSVGEAESEEDIYDTSPMTMRVNENTHLPMKAKPVEPAWEMVINPHESKHPASTASSSVSGSGSDHSASSTSTSASSISASPAPQNTSSTHKAIIISSPPPPQARQRSATTTTTAPRQRRNTSVTSNGSIDSSTLSVRAPAVNDDETEARLKTAADVSIARQISVSRQQRQLLIPINTKPSITSLSKKHNQNFPSPLNVHIGVNRVTSPLGAVAAAAAEERERELKGKDGKESQLSEKKKEKKIERLVEGVKPSTPTLVVVPGPDKNQTVESWGGATAVHQNKHVGLAERRKGGANKMGEIKVGLAVNNAAHHQRPKSEKAVVERMSIASN